MIAAIVDQTSPAGVVPVTQFQKAADAATALTEFVNAFVPPKDPADWLAYDTGWPGDQYQAPSGGPNYAWGYDFDSPGLVEVFRIPPDARELPLPLNRNSNSGPYHTIYMPPNGNTRIVTFETPADFASLVALQFKITGSAIMSGVNLQFTAGWNSDGEPLSQVDSGLNYPLELPVADLQYAIDIGAIFDVQPLVAGQSVGVIGILDAAAPGDIHVIESTLWYMPKAG